MANVCWGWWWMWLRLAGRSERPRVRDGGDAHIRGLGTPRPWFVARPLSEVERAARGAVLRRHFAELLCASRDARGASLAATGCERLARVGEPRAGAWRVLRWERGCV